MRLYEQDYLNKAKVRAKCWTSNNNKKLTSVSQQFYFACFQSTADGPAGQPGEDVRSRAVRVSSGVIARVPIPVLRCLVTIVSVTATRIGFVEDKVAQKPCPEVKESERTRKP